MTVAPPAIMRFAVYFVSSLLLTGCSNFTGKPLDDENNPDFLAGIRRKSALNFSGAIESFERALQAAPNSARAHFELGLLYEQDADDPASAIYHFQKFLKLSPESNLSNTARERIDSCKVELAKTVSFSSVSKKVFAEMTRLATENSQLREKVMQLNLQLAGMAPSPSEETDPGSEESRPPLSPLTGSPNPRQTHAQTQGNSSDPARTHVIRRNDTFYSLSRRYGVTVAELKSANPSVVPEKLKLGQTITIPVPGN